MDVTFTIIAAAVIVAASSAASAFLLAYQSRIVRRAERIEDYEHQDELAQRAAEQTRILIETNERIAIRTNQAAEVLEGKIDVIHLLVNSGLTAAKQSELDAVERDLASLKEIMALHRVAGHEPDQETRSALDGAMQKAIDLRAELAERRSSDAVAQAQTETNRAREKRQRPGEATGDTRRD